MGSLRVILGDQLTSEISSLADIDARADVVLLAEVREEATYVNHHKQKLVLVFSAMRHFAEQLENDGLNVRYVYYDDDDNTGSLATEVSRVARESQSDRIVVTEPGEYRVQKDIEGWSAVTDLDVDVRTDERWFCTRDEFKTWAQDRKSLRMEYFYREMRKRTGYLMEGNDPAGGRWNYDAENRKSIPDSVEVPRRKQFEPDSITQEVIDLVSRHFKDNFGSLDNFGWAVTRTDALEALDHFVSQILPSFGDYQDAMKRTEAFLFHSVLSPYINIGLLNPREVCEAAITMYEKDSAPIASVEGFVRQILGWREFVHGVYWYKMPEYGDTNFFNAKRSLPDFYWTAQTDMACVADAIESTRDYAYAHHIQRLMITGNFALLAGLSPAEVEDWYLAVYADAYEWVELPNTHGMALYADGGVMSTKPYAASGSYINRMSNYCSGCRYDPKVKLGENACPFNYLYWNFVIGNENKLRDNPRMGFTMKNLERMGQKKRDAIVSQAEDFLRGL